MDSVHGADQFAVKDEIDEKDDFLFDEEALQEDGAAYKPRPQLSKPVTLLRTLGYLMKQLENKTIDVDPEYQREVVWTADRMTGLINSLMENFYIPPIILNKKTLPARSKSKYICVDGKQRLSSVQLFMRGIIPCSDYRGEKWYFCDSGQGGRRRKILPEALQREFQSKEFVSFEYADLTPEQEEDLFARVQMGVQLTLAEKMRASTGPWQELARCYVEDFPIIYDLLKDRSRAKDFQMTLSCFSQIIEVQHPTASNGVPILKTNHSHLPKLLNNKGAVDDATKSHLASVWTTFQDVINLDPNAFTNADRRLRGVQTFAPVEMVGVTVLISMYSETRNNRLLLDDIKLLREELRVYFADLRLNAPTWKWLWDFIENLEQVRGAVNGSTIDRSVKPKPGVSTPRPAEPATAAAPFKRGRPNVKEMSLAIASAAKAENATAPPTDSRPLKRKRTVSGPSTIPETTSIRSRSSITSSIPSPSIAPRYSHSTGFSGSLGTASGPQKARRTPAMQAIAPPPLPPPHSTSSSTPPRAPLTTPPEARQNRFTELNSYRAPEAPMGTNAPSAASMTAPTTITPLSTPPADFIASTSPSIVTLNGNSGWYHKGSHNVLAAPTGVLKIVSPTEIAPQARPPPPQPQQPRPNGPPRPISRCSGAIDLTEDDEDNVEEAAQSLLSSFRATAFAGHQPRINNIAVPPSNEPIGSSQFPHRAKAGFPSSSKRMVKDLTAEEEPANPYAKLKLRQLEAQQRAKQQQQAAVAKTTTS